jgi:hypothetical protein
MSKIRDLGIQIIPETMRPSEIDNGRYTPGTMSNCLPGTLMSMRTTVLTDEDIRLLRQQLHQ